MMDDSKRMSKSDPSTDAAMGRRTFFRQTLLAAGAVLTLAGLTGCPGGDQEDDGDDGDDDD